MKNTTKRFAIGTLIAAGAGYVAGILTAPKSGKETRKDIKVATDKTVAEAEKQLKHLHTELNDLTEQVKKGAEKAKGEAKKDFDAAVDFTKQAKDKAREVLSAVHEGDADDKDLKKAVQEAQKSVDHLKTFLKR
jgi:gas vesicle protein